ncbi:MAG: peptide ABC transporter substrate-binding protein [Alphaproteobacteria bacterium]|nr:peptide ABC transporter substrate-binding protein [Alphaproteobacteria bacterium]
MTRLDRRALFASGAAAALLAATGVSASPKRGGRLRAALSRALFDQATNATLYENLTEIGADGTVRGELATAWASENDARVWRFNLRKDVFFHDGTRFDTSQVRLPFALKKLGSHTLQVTLDAPNPNLPYLLAHPGFELSTDDGIGTGMYQVQKLEAGRHFIGVRVADHWKALRAGWFDSVEFVQFSDSSIRAEALRDGMVDVADISQLDGYTDYCDYLPLPDGQTVTFILSQAVSLPSNVGKAWPLDNLRMAERWWIA